jgi:hypothetical protein
VKSGLQLQDRRGELVKKKLQVTVSVLVLSTLLGGCYSLREFSWTPDKLKSGETAVGTLGLIGTGEPAKAYFFISLLNEAQASVQYRKVKFDSAKVLGPDSVKMVSDPDLAAVYENEGCPFTPVSEGVLFRTEKQVRSDTRKLPEASFRVKAVKDGAGFGGFVTTGVWEDDGDKVPEDPDSSDDVVDCTGTTTTLLPPQGASGDPRGFDLEGVLGK